MKKELNENKKKAEIEKASLVRSHRAEVKIWRKDLKDETKQRIMSEKKLENSINDSVDTKTYTISTPTLKPAISPSEPLCIICRKKDLNYLTSTPSIVSYQTPCLTQLQRTPDLSPP